MLSVEGRATCPLVEDFERKRWSEMITRFIGQIKVSKHELSVRVKSKPNTFIGLYDIIKSHFNHYKHQTFLFTVIFLPSARSDDLDSPRKQSYFTFINLFVLFSFLKKNVMTAFIQKQLYKNHTVLP